MYYIDGGCIFSRRESVCIPCHWWNSVTSKKYGYMWNKISTRTYPDFCWLTIPFYDRPIYFMEARLKKEKVVLGEIGIFVREPGCTAITLVAGSRKRMFPSRSSPNVVRSFTMWGIVEVDNISIAWPNVFITDHSNPLADIYECRTIQWIQMFYI